MRGGILTNDDPRATPAYSVTEAARYLRLPAATLRSWVLGRPFASSAGPKPWAPLLKLAQSEPPTLSFNNLIEAHVLRALRTEHGVPLDAVRKAVRFAERELGIKQLLLHEELRAAGKALFLDRYEELINLSASGQLAMRKAFEAHLKRVEWGQLRFPVRLYPFLATEGSGDARPIVIDPEISFGRPVIRGAFVSTRTIVDRIDAGESVEDVARDYEIQQAALEEAVLYERAA